MASLLSTLTAGQLWELNSVMAKNMTSEEALNLLSNPDAWTKMIAVMRDQPSFKLAHGVWCCSKDVFGEENKRLSKAGYRIGHFTWIGSRELPERTDDMEYDEVWALETSLETVGASFEFYVRWMLGAHKQHWRWYEMRSDEKHMRLLEGQEFQSMTRRWRRVKLNSKLSSSPEEVEFSEPFEDIAGLDALAALAQNPMRVRKMDAKKWCYIVFSGIRLCEEGKKPWSLSPRVDYENPNGKVILAANLLDIGLRPYSCPLRVQGLEI